MTDRMSLLWNLTEKDLNSFTRFIEKCCESARVGSHDCVSCVVEKQILLKHLTLCEVSSVLDRAAQIRCPDQGVMNIFCWEWSLRQRTRCALFHQNQQFQAAVREHQLRARNAVNEAVQEHSERYDAAMLHLLQAVQNREGGQMENTARRVAMVIGTAAQCALRGQRHDMLEEQQQLVQAGEKEEECVRTQLSSAFSLQRACFERVLQERVASQEQTIQRIRVA